MVASRERAAIQSAILGIRVYSRARVRHPSRRVDGPRRRCLGGTGSGSSAVSTATSDLEPAEMTDRLLRALENPYIRVLGHLTGRMLLHREGYHIRLRPGGDGSGKKRRAARGQRKPGSDLYSRTADPNGKGKGMQVRHRHRRSSSESPAQMPYGLLMARRGWLTAADVINTLPLPEFDKAYRKTGQQPKWVK